MNTQLGAKTMSMEDGQKNVRISIFPNPNTGTFTIEPNQQLSNILIEVYDVLGRTIYKTQVAQLNKFSVDIGDYEPGMYYVHLSGEGIHSTEKIIKQ
jgi:hypothetical protein